MDSENSKPKKKGFAASIGWKNDIYFNTKKKKANQQQVQQSEQQQTGRQQQPEQVQQSGYSDEEMREYLRQERQARRSGGPGITPRCPRLQ